MNSFAATPPGAIASPDQLSVAACCGMQWRRVLLCESAKWRDSTCEVLDEGDCGDGQGRGHGRDDAGGAARAGTGDKRRARSGTCVGIHRGRADVALDLDRSSPPGPHALD